MERDWFILRTAGRSTLLLARTLAADGFEVWTPARMHSIRVPRLNVRREVRLPILPSFVFAKAHHLSDLIELGSLPLKPRRNVPAFRRDEPNEPRYHRDFSVFHYLDKIPMIADQHLAPLRNAELNAVRKKDRPRFDRGAKVRVGSGAFEGLKGKVERCKSGYALVIFDDFSRPVKIPTFLLSENEAINARRGLDEAA